MNDQKYNGFVIQKTPKGYTCQNADGEWIDRDTLPLIKLAVDAYFVEYPE